MYPQQPGYPAAPYPNQPQYAPQPVSAPAPAPAPVMPNFVDPNAGGGELAPLPRHLIGYAVAVLPTAYDPSNLGPNKEPRPQITVDFVVVGVDPGGNPLPPVEYGDSQARDNTARPNILRLEAFPAEFRGARWTNGPIVNALSNHVGTGNVVLARFRIGDTGNRPPLLEVMQANDAGRAALAAAWQQRAQDSSALRRSVGNGITEINGGMAMIKKDAPAGMPPQPGAAYAGQPGQWGGPVAPPMPPQPGAQVAYPPAPPQPTAPTPQGAPMPPAAVAAGWTPEAWAAAPPPVKAAFGG